MPRFLKIILWALGSLAIFCFISLALLPTLISTSWGTKKTIEIFNSQGNGTLSIDSIHLSWVGEQTLQNLAYKDKDGETLVSIELLNTRTSLLYLLFGGRSLGSTIIRQPFIVFEHQEKEPKEDKKDKEEKGRKKRSGEKWINYLFHFEENLSMLDGTVIFRSAQAEPITISEISIQKIDEPGVFHIAANTLQGGAQGTVEIDISLHERIQAKGNIKNFPLSIFDRLDQSTLFTDAVGKTIDISFDLTKEKNEAFSLSADIKSQNLNGFLKGKTQDNNLVLDPSSQFVFTMAPKFFKALLPESQKEEWILARNTDVKFTFSKGIFPLDQKKIDFYNTVLEAKATVDRAEITHRTLSGYSLNQFSFQITTLNNLEIAYSGEIQGREPSIIAGKFLITPERDIHFTSNYQGFPISLISLVSPSIEKNMRTIIGSFFDLTTEGVYRNGKIEMQISVASPDLQASGTLIGGLDNLNFDLSGNKSLAGKPAEYLGSTMRFEIEGLTNISRDEISIPLLNGTITTPYYEVDVKGTVGERGKRLDLNEMELIATGRVIELPYNKEFPDIDLNNGGFFINMDGPSNKIFGQAFLNNQTTSDLFSSKALEARFEINNYIHEDSIDFKKAEISFETELNQLPLALLDPFLPRDVEITKVLGTTATIDAKGRYSPEHDPRFSLEFNGKGEGFDAELSITIDGTLNIAQNRPAFVHWELTPERYDALIKYLSPEHRQAFFLTTPASVDISIKELTCPTTPPKGVGQFLCETGFVGDLSIGTLHFRRLGSQEYLVIKNTAGSIKGENFSKAIELHLRGDILAHNVPQSEKSSFQFDGVMVDFWTPEGKFNREGLAVDGELSLELLPVRQITEIYPMDEDTKRLVQAVLGELVNARIYGRISQLTGPLTVDIKSSNFKATLPILLHPNAIYLRDVVNAEITITPEVNQTLITDINPLLITGAYSDNPIKVFIDPQGFVLPIRPYFLQGVQIGKAVIDIGRIRVRNGGQIQQLMNFLKATDITPEGEMNAWFTPIFMSLNNGVATYQRFDMLLANEFHIALWGSVNLITNQVNMTLGIAPSTLKKRFNVSGISKKDMFQVKMRGTTNKLDLDWSSASTRIGILVAKTAGGKIGALIGGIIEQIVTALGEEPTPPPTTSPFPWESQK